MRTVLLAALLALPVAGEELVLDSWPCDVEAPETRLDRPTCVEYDFDNVLIKSMHDGDSSARELLKQRHDTTLTSYERIRIAGALLRHVDDDGAYWREISMLAENAIMARKSALLVRCFDQALDLAGDDPRGLELMVRALESDDATVVGIAIAAIGRRNDESLLPLIEKAIERLPEEHLGFALYTFHSPAAKALAKRVLSAEEFEDFKQARDEDLHDRDSRKTAQ